MRIETLHTLRKRRTSFLARPSRDRARRALSRAPFSGLIGSLASLVRSWASRMPLVRSAESRRLRLSRMPASDALAASARKSPSIARNPAPPRWRAFGPQSEPSKRPRALRSETAPLLARCRYSTRMPRARDAFHARLCAPEQGRRGEERRGEEATRHPASAAGRARATARSRLGAAMCRGSESAPDSAQARYRPCAASADRLRLFCLLCEIPPQRLPAPAGALRSADERAIGTVSRRARPWTQSPGPATHPPCSRLPTLFPRTQLPDLPLAAAQGPRHKASIRLESETQPP